MRRHRCAGRPTDEEVVWKVGAQEQPVDCRLEGEAPDRSNIHDERAFGGEFAGDAAETARGGLDALLEIRFRRGRVEAIAREAGINTERNYQYFGNKEGLFAAVLESEVERLLDGIDIMGAGADALGTLAGDLFDRTAQHPRLVRLLLCEILELAEP